jgi:acetylornithine deacetylase
MMRPADRPVGGPEVDPGRIAADLRELVRVPSVTGDETAATDLAARLLEDAGAVVERLDVDPATIEADPDFPGAEMPRTTLPLAFGRLGRPLDRRILLVGHLDVVPVGDVSAWTVDPWAGEVQAGRLFGRGACDMKGGVAAIIGAVRALTVTGLAGRIDGELVVVLVPGEEDGGTGMLAAIRTLARADGSVADAAVIAEPTGLQLIVAHAGAITFRLEVPGRAAHASMRREGVSALDGLAVLISALAADEAARNASETDPLMTALGLPYPTIVGKVQGGDWASTVMDRVVAEGRYGVRLGQTWRDAEADLRRCIEDAAARDPWLRDHPPSVQVTGGRFSSARVDPDGPLVNGLGAAVEGVRGRAPARLGVPYGADMRLLIDEGATPTVMFGPGDVAIAHAADEHVALADVADAARVLALWVVSTLGAEDRSTVGANVAGSSHPAAM